MPGGDVHPRPKRLKAQAASPPDELQSLAHEQDKAEKEKERNHWDGGPSHSFQERRESTQKIFSTILKSWKSRNGGSEAPLLAAGHLIHLSIKEMEYNCS